MLSLFRRMAWRNILRNSRKSGLAVLAVAACYFSLNLFQGYIQGTEAIFLDSYEKRSMFGDILIRRKGVHHFLSMDKGDLLSAGEQGKLEALLKQSGQADLWVRFLRVDGTLSNGSAQTGFLGYGVDAEKGYEMRKPGWEWNAVAGDILRSDQAQEILLGQRLGLLLGCRASSTGRFITGRGGYEAKARPFACASPKIQVSAVTLGGQANALELRVAGLVDSMFRELDLRFVYMPLKAAQRLSDTDRVSFYSLRLKQGVNRNNFLRNLNAAFQRGGLDLTAHSWQEDELGDFYRRTMDFLHLFRNFMVIVILGVALLSIFNTFFRNVQERTRETGVLRTLGYTVKQVRLLFLLETFFLALIGIGLGGSLALLTAAALNRLSVLYKIGLLTQPVPFIVDLSPFILGWTFLLVLLVALLAAWLPVWINGKKPITETLA
jgi:putative ABC transport system permease protein